MGMMADIKENVRDWTDEVEVAEYIAKIIRKEAYDHSGLVYGMGHAVYTYSDPRCVLLKERATRLAEIKPEFKAELELYKLIEKLTPEVFARVKGSEKVMCANVDLYSGMVYKMLGISADMYTPLFAISRIVGWCAHRLEETRGSSKIIRPAYKSLIKSKEYISIDERG